MADISIIDEGTLVLFQPNTDEARQHLQDHCPDAQWFGSALVCEHRYASRLAENLLCDGLSLQ